MRETLESPPSKRYWGAEPSREGYQSPWRSRCGSRVWSVAVHASHVERPSVAPPGAASWPLRLICAGKMKGGRLEPLRTARIDGGRRLAEATSHAAGSDLDLIFSMWRDRCANGHRSLPGWMGAMPS